MEIDPVTNQKASTKFWIRQKPISIDSDHLCACDLVEERSPSEWNSDFIFSSVHDIHGRSIIADAVHFLPQLFFCLHTSTYFDSTG